MTEPLIIYATAHQMSDGGMFTDAQHAASARPFMRPGLEKASMSLDSALDHLRRFRSTFNAGEPVDEESGLTADDLTTIIQAVEAFGEDVVAGDPV